MYLQVTDGTAQLADYVIVHDDGTELCFSQQEVDKYKAIFDAEGIAYTVETVTWTDEQRQIVSGKIYSNADEARNDINGTRQPTELEVVQNELKHKDEQIEQMKSENTDTTALLLELYEAVYPV